MTDHVIFRYDPDNRPQITFRGVPSGCAGGAGTMAEARGAYRTCLSARLHVDRRALPPVVEHLEGLVRGMWVRTKVGAVHRDRSSDKMLLQILLAAGDEQAGLRERVTRLTEAGAEPVVVLTEPDYALETLLDQMSAGDTLVVAHSEDNESVGWSVLYGVESGAGQDVPSVGDDGGFRATPVATFTRTCAAVGRVVHRRPAAHLAS
ncbi:hypothetical protein ORI20_09480 [Mycobacterium sp. CVI_P3]|uniref:Uncharacterized protein n=1 Tax=Mycobacterium pinniadriaticum TaxID=2994102 RepID=A0ABT3SBS4_9MYCO|nr:hypothetical protein [Mycobacterium pinniadriaticum]MCX2930505.1 hypothetical protein [Mycobacterium pinniadriaticum]MCX2936929.1 hypothetical protein [Mycobacterium pinniadriaticum]